MTTRGMKEAEAEEVARLIVAALKGHSEDILLAGIRGEVADLAAGFTPYPADFARHVGSVSGVNRS